jgi:hypothetical protein
MVQEQIILVFKQNLFRLNFHDELLNYHNIKIEFKNESCFCFYFYFIFILFLFILIKGYDVTLYLIIAFFVLTF